MKRITSFFLLTTLLHLSALADSGESAPEKCFASICIDYQDEAEFVKKYGPGQTEGMSYFVTEDALSLDQINHCYYHERDGIWIVFVFDYFRGTDNAELFEIITSKNPLCKEKSPFPTKSDASTENGMAPGQKVDEIVAKMKSPGRFLSGYGMDFGFDGSMMAYELDHDLLSNYIFISGGVVEYLVLSNSS